MSDMVLTLTINAEALKKEVIEVQGTLKKLSGEKVRINTKEAENDVNKLRDAIAMWGLAIKGVEQSINIAVRAMVGFITPALEAEKAQGDLAAALRNTGIEAEGTVMALAEHAKELQKMTKYEDDAIISGTALMQNIGKLSKEQLPDAQRAAIGLASAYRLNLETAFELVGKAAAGSTAMLGKYGIVLDSSLSPQEKFTQLLTVGAEKFGIATEEVNQAGNKWLQFKNQLGELIEAIGATVLPAFNAMMKAIQPIVEWFTALSTPMKAVLVLLPAMAAGWYKLVAAQVAYTTATATLSGAITGAANAIRAFFVTLGPVGLGIAALTLAIGLFTASADGSVDAITQMEESYVPLIDRMGSVNLQAEKEQLTFKALSESLLDLRGKTKLTADDKELMGQTIKELNENYGQYLGNIDLETSSYNELAKALDKASNAILANATAKALGNVYTEQMEQIVKLQQAIRALPANQKPTEVGVGGEFGKNMQSVFGINPTGLVGSGDEDNPLLSRYYRLNEQLRKAQAELDAIGKDYAVALTNVTNFNLTGAGSSGSGSVSGGSSTAIDSEFKSIIAKVEEFNQTQLQQIQAKYDRQREIVRKNTVAESAEQKALLDGIKAMQDKEERDYEDEQGKKKIAAWREQIKNLSAYYDEVRFLDSGYYEWKVAAIETEVKAMGLSEDETNKLIKLRLKGLKDEQAAFNALPLTEVLEKYRAWKAESADGREVGVQAWKQTLKGLQDFKKALEELDPTMPGVKEAIAKIQGEIEVAQMQITKSGNWFWNGLLGYDPNSETDKEKISAIKRTTADLAQQAVSFSQNMITLSNQRRDKELAALDERAKAEKWSDEETLRRKQAITDKYASEAKRIGKIQQAVSIAQATINMAEAAIAAYKAMVGIPVVGPVLAPAAAAAAGLAGAAQIAVIKMQKFARGGRVVGAGGPTDDLIPAMLSNGEYVINARASAQYQPVLDAINAGQASMPAFDLRGVERRLDALNMNIAQLELGVVINNKAPGVETVVEKQERVKAKLQSRGVRFEYGSI